MIAPSERSDPQPPVVYEFGDFEFVAADRILTRHGTRVSLTPKAIDTLAMLVNARGRLLTKDELLKGVWPDTFVEENSLTRNISVLRKALGGDASDQQFIETVPKSGYRFSAPLRARSTPSAPTDRKRSPRLILAGALLLATAAGVYAGWQWLAPRPTAFNPDTIRQIAVLPLQIIGPSSGIEHLAIGIPDTIITRLANVQTLRVRSTGLIAPTAGTDPRSVGRDLGVDHVVGGTLQAVSGVARINLQLLRVADGVVVWGEALELPVDQLLALQDHHVTDRVVQALHLRTTSAERERAFRRYTEQPEAYALYLRGRSLLANYTDATMTEAIARFEEALRVDPRYALARAGLATALAFFSVRYAYESEAQKWAARAEEEARRALAMDPALAEAHLALASAAGTIHRNFDWRTALSEADRALAINPNLDLAHTARARALFHLGLFDAAEEATARADAGAPRTVENARILALITLHRGRFTDALDHAEQLARRTDAPAVQSYIAMSAFYLGDIPRGRSILEGLKRGGRPDIRGQAFLAAIEAANHNDQRASEIIRTIEAQPYMDHHVATSLAGAQAQLGNHDEALRWLRWAAGGGFPCYPWFEVDPLLQPLRNTPAYVAFMRELRISFDDVQERYGQRDQKR